MQLLITDKSRTLEKKKNNIVLERVCLTIMTLQFYVSITNIVLVSMFSARPVLRGQAKLILIIR